MPSRSTAIDDPPGDIEETTRRTCGNEIQGALEDRRRRRHPPPGCEGGSEGTISRHEVDHDPVWVQDLDPFLGNRVEGDAELRIGVENEDRADLTRGSPGKSGDHRGEAKACRGARVVSEHEDVAKERLGCEHSTRGREGDPFGHVERGAVRTEG